MKMDPQRLSPHAGVAPFDAEAFERDPDAYLSRIEPARCYQTAKPGPDVPPLDVGGSLRAQVTWGDAVVLWTRTVPRAPVTFTAFQGGYFKENGVASVTVRADAQGLASAHYAVDAGITGDVNVIAGSPVAVGAQRFFITVNPT
jgi:hypothetical protein